MSKSLAEMIAVMQAAQEGKAIQVRNESYPNWNNVPLEHIVWNWHGWDYRVKPETVKPREVIVKFKQSGAIDYARPCTHIPLSNHEVCFIELTPEIKAKLGL